MGVDISYYLGPVAVVEVKRKDAIGFGCVNAACRDYRKSVGGAFCSTCAQQLGNYPIPDRAEAVNEYSLFGGKEPMWSSLSSDEKRRFFVPNTRREAPRSFGFDECSDEQYISHETIGQELAWFSSAFAGEIKELEREYGAVLLHWMRFVHIS